MVEEHHVDSLMERLRTNQSVTKVLMDGVKNEDEKSMIIEAIKVHKGIEFGITKIMMDGSRVTKWFVIGAENLDMYQ